MSRPETIKILADLFTHELSMPEERCNIYNEKFKIASVKGMFLEIAFLGEKVFGSKLEYDPDTSAGLVEIKTINALEQYQVVIFSYDGTARQRKNETSAVFHSTYGQQLCEKYSMGFPKLPSTFVDISHREGSKILNKYAMTFNVTLCEEFRKTVEYFSDIEVPPAILVNP